MAELTVHRTFDIPNSNRFTFHILPLPNAQSITSSEAVHTIFRAVAAYCHDDPLPLPVSQNFEYKGIRLSMSNPAAPCGILTRETACTASTGLLAYLNNRQSLQESQFDIFSAGNPSGTLTLRRTDGGDVTEV